MVVVAVPTLSADGVLTACLAALEQQTFQDFVVIIIDNSGQNRVTIDGPKVQVIANTSNRGFGAAVNQAAALIPAPYLAVLNDDATPDPRWLESLVGCAERHPEAGMFASCVYWGDSQELDSAGMLLTGDGTAKQRGHRQAAVLFASDGPSLFPSGSAAMYRRTMLEQVGLFEESFFLYCEDTDLGLRGRWAGWSCQYVSKAIVRHTYSHSAGRASPLKAYLVERNRMFTVVRNFPFRLLWLVPLHSVVRYAWHGIAIIRGVGLTTAYRRDGNSLRSLAWLCLRAHLSVVWHTPRLISQRLRLRRQRTIPTRSFVSAIKFHTISVRDAALL